MNNLPSSFTRSGTPNSIMGIYMYKKTKLKRCAFCGGEGHYASKCSTKKTIDRNAKMANLGIEWGAVKSRFLSEGYTSRAAIYKFALVEQIKEYQKKLNEAELRSQGAAAQTK